MARSRDNKTYHLTPDGWIVADSPPPNRVETWTCSVEEAGWSKRYVEWTCMWANPNVLHADRNSLRERYAEQMLSVGRDSNPAVVD